VLEANAAAAANAEPAGAQHNPEAQHAVQSDRFFGAASRMHQQVGSSLSQSTQGLVGDSRMHVSWHLFDHATMSSSASKGAHLEQLPALLINVHCVSHPATP